MNNDSLITEGSNKIELSIQFYEQKLNYIKSNLSLKTNCKFSFNKDEKNNFISLRVASLKELVEIYGFLKGKEKEFVDGMSDILSTMSFCNNSDREKSVLNFEWMGYSISEWKSDIFQLYSIKLYSEKIETLKHNKEKLESMYSKELKDSIEINKILSDLV